MHVFLFLSVPILSEGFYYDVIMGLITGLVVSLLDVFTQYFIQKGRIKNEIFNCYFDLYKKIYNIEKTYSILGYNCWPLYKKMESFSIEFSKLSSEYSGFINNKHNLLYKKLNPSIQVNYDIYNLKNILKLMFPLNKRKYDEIIVSLKKELEKILKSLNKEKFYKEFEDYKRISKLILGKKLN